MSAFEDQLWSELVSDHAEQIGRAGEAIAAMSAASSDSSGRSRWRATRRRPNRGQLVLVSTTVAIACLASAIIVTHSTTRNPTGPVMSRAGFAITDNHDGTLSITLHKRSALPTLNASLVSYGLKAKLPRGVWARTLSLTATCPKVPTLPGGGHPAGVSVGPHAPLPSKAQALKNCLLHTTS